ncbi:MAG: ATP-binding cassette domain-containing protein [Tepidisphaera sp.]|nr:ATP-binding cassette domain-containing protein [Tepidisphaera sp.]
MIQTRGITKRYGKLVALNDLTLDIGPGEVFGFIGPNGAGKTTAMKILACLMKPDAGSASVCGLDITKEPDQIRRMIGYMPDFLGVYDDLTVDEYLQFFAAAFDIPRRERPKIIGQVLELTDLTEKQHALVDGLSRGMQQRLGVARVLVHDPKVLFLDEPASGLDPRARIEMRSLLTELGRMGKSLMVSSHILTELAEMCTSIGIIERGKLLYAGSIDEALAKTKAARGEGDRIRVTLEESSVSAGDLAAALAGEPRFARVAPDGRALVIDLAAGAHGHHFVIEALLTRGAKIAAFEPQEVKLEDAFLKLTTGALQ